MQLAGPDGAAGHVFQSGQPVTIRIALRSPSRKRDFVIGIGIFNAEGVCCYGTNTSLEELKAVRIFGDAEARFTDRQPRSRRRHVQARCRDPQAAMAIPYDYHRLLYTFRVKSRTKDVGIYRPRIGGGSPTASAFERTGQPR